MAYGKYTLVGALTMSFEARYDNVALGILWATLVLAVLGTMLVVSQTEAARKLLEEYIKAVRLERL